LARQFFDSRALNERARQSFAQKQAANDGFVPLKDSPVPPHNEDVPASAVALGPPQKGQGSAPGVHSSGNHPTTFDHIYAQWFHEVCRWARGLGGLNADVEDIAQEVFIVVSRKLPDFDGRHERAWLYRITQRTVSDYRRRAWFRRTVRPAAEFFGQVVDHADGPRELVMKRDAERQIATILDKLSTVRRTAFILFEIEGYSGEEIAELENVPVATIHTRLHYARKDFYRHVAQLADTQEPAS
jgi:RNA polymerase sigma-70 factor (ECF subfamily)